MAAGSFWGLLSESIRSASALEQGVMLFLVGLSIVSWAVIIMKLRALRQARSNDALFHAAFASASHSGEVLERGRGTVGPAPLYAIFAAGLAAHVAPAPPPPAPAPEGQVVLLPGRDRDERVRLAMEHAQRAEMSVLGRHLQVLATAGSASPFIGLFGTVWGIMATFQALGSAKSASLQVLAPPIAAALIATAAGLAVAIPAVIAYNWISARLDEEQEAGTTLIERVRLILGGTAPSAAAPPAVAPPAVAPPAVAPPVAG